MTRSDGARSLGRRGCGCERMIRSYRNSVPRRTCSKKSNSLGYSTIRELWMCLTSQSVARELRARKGRRSGSPFPLSFSISVPLPKVSGLELRVLADPKVLSLLQSPELHDRPRPHHRAGAWAPARWPPPADGAPRAPRGAGHTQGGDPMSPRRSVGRDAPGTSTRGKVRRARAPHGLRHATASHRGRRDRIAVSTARVQSSSISRSDDHG